MQSFARPITAEEVDSESDDDDMEDDEERPVDGAEAEHLTTQGQAEETRHGEEDDVVAGKPGVEHGPMATTGGNTGSSEATGDDAEAKPPRSKEKSTAGEGGILPRGGDAPGEGGGDASEIERPNQQARVAQID